jgi:hypothetical protein
MRPPRVFASIAVVVLVVGTLGVAAVRGDAAPSAQDLQPKFRSFVASGDSALTQSGASVPTPIGTARSGELAVGDVTGDTVNDVVVGANDGKVYVNPFGTETSFTPFSGYTGPLSVAVGNLDGDAALEIVAATGTGAPPRYRIFNNDGSPVAAEVQPYASTFAGGVRVAVGDVTGDATKEVITGAGPGGGPQVSIFNTAGAQQSSFFAYDPSSTGGVHVAAGNLDGDPADEILVGPGASSTFKNPRAFNGDASEVSLGLAPGPLSGQNDVRVAVGVVNGVQSFVTTDRLGTKPELEVYPIPATTFRRVDPADADGSLSPAISGGQVLTLDTGPRLIAVSNPSVPDHTRAQETVYGSGLAALMADNVVHLNAGQGGFTIPAEALNADDLKFDLVVPAFVNSGDIQLAVGNDTTTAVARDNILSIPPRAVPLDAFVTTGVGSGGGPHVRTFTSDGPTGGGFMAGNPTSGSGVRVARGDLDNDGVDEIVTGAGPHSAPVVSVYTKAGALVRNFLVYDSGFLGGIFVAVGDVDGDGVNDIITAPDAGGGPHVKVFAASGQLKSQFMAYDPAFSGGVRVATADVDGDQIDEIVTAPGPGGGPHVKALTDTGEILEQFMAYDPKFTGGVYVAGADLTGEAIDEIVTGPGAGGGPHVRAFFDGEEVLGFMAYDPTFTGGVSVGRVGDDILGPDLIVVGAGPGGGPHVQLFDGDQVVDSFYAYDPNFHGGVLVAGGVA